MASTYSPVGVVSFEQARHIVEEHAAKVLAARGDPEKIGDERTSVGLAETETVELLAARGRVLAEAIVADRDFPPFPRAIRDGYAVRAADVERVPARLEVIGEVKAGDSQGTAGGSITVNRGQAASIMTGAPVPAGADAVVMVEYTAVTEPLRSTEIPHPNALHPSTPTPGVLGTPALHPSTLTPGVQGTPAAISGALGWGTLERHVEIQRSVVSGENFVPQGAEARAGQVVVEGGKRLDHALIAIAAAVGKSRVEVFRRPRVAVLSTGDEVVEITATPEAAQIRNSNSYSLAAQIEEAGGEAVRLPIAPDEPRRLRELIEEGLACDLLLMTGGVSMGKYDLVEQVLAEMKAEFYFTGARIQPGRPIVFGACGADTPFDSPSLRSDSLRAGPVRAPTAAAPPTWTGVSAPHGSATHYFFGLPGNPVSTMVTFRLFARPLLEAMAGMKRGPLVFLKARLKAEVRTKTGLTRFLPAVLSGEFENTEVQLSTWQGSGDIAALARTNCYLVVPPDRERIEAGEWVSVLML